VPTYEYLCASCGERYDKREGFDAPARQKCQSCRKSTAQRVLYAPPVVFKGSGFYKTDSRRSSSTPATTTPAPVAPETPPVAETASTETSATESAAAG
jgi:putative FmdB family regulatory protein